MLSLKTFKSHTLAWLKSKVALKRKLGGWRMKKIEDKIAGSLKELEGIRAIKNTIRALESELCTALFGKFMT